MSSDEPVIRARNLGKCYQLYAQPQDRLKQFLWRGKRQYFREFWALRDVNFDVMPGEVVGIIGRNGSGKSTLLQLVCGTLTPTTGEVAVKGRVAALLELGAGFNPEFTGRENVFMSAAIMGLSQAEIAARYEDIVEFSGIRDFIDQPVKTYSSGMYVRLAFSVAISVDPDILVIDEALSVGDGEFSRRSFDRIMALKNAGKTILFCSHSMYQIEAICNRAIWLNQGIMEGMGDPARMVVAYSAYSNASNSSRNNQPEDTTLPPSVSHGAASIRGVEVSVDNKAGKKLEVVSGQGEVAVKLWFAADPTLPTPSVGVCFFDSDSKVVASAGTHIDGFMPTRDGDGAGEVTAVFPGFPLLKGNYSVHVFLLCELGIHLYDSANMVAELAVSQLNMELGVVSLPHRWKGQAG